MRLKKSVVAAILVIAVLFVTQIVHAQSLAAALSSTFTQTTEVVNYAPEDFSVEVEPVKKKIEYGSPLILKMHVTLNRPYISIHTGKPARVLKRGLELHLLNTKTGQTSKVVFRLPVEFYCHDDKGLEFSTTQVILWDLYKERKKLIANLIFDSPGTYRLTLKRKNKEISNTVDVVVEPSELGERALSLLAEPNDLVFLVGGLFKSPQTVSALKEVGRQCEGTVLAKWAAARLGLTYFEEFQRRQPSFKKAAELYKQGSLEDPSFKAAYSYLRQATELPDEFPIRSEALGELVELLCVTGELDDALKLSGELVNKYPHTEHGRKARLWEKELAELQQAEQIRQPAPDPNKLAGNNEGRGNWQRWLVLAGAVGVAIAAGVVLVVLLRKKPRAK